MSPHPGRDAAVQPKQPPSGAPIMYPVCGWWACDDDEDWEFITSDDPDYPAVRREHDIARYHQPTDDWARRLKEERDRLTNGEPLWWGKQQPPPS